MPFNQQYTSTGGRRRETPILLVGSPEVRQQGTGLRELLMKIAEPPDRVFPSGQGSRTNVRSEAANKPHRQAWLLEEGRKWWC